MFLGDVSLFWYADDIFDLTVQDMAEVGNGVNVEIAALPQFGQRSGIDVELVDELVLCDPFLFQKLPERRVVHIVAFIRILHDFIIWKKTCFIIGIIVSMCCYGVEVMDLSNSIYDPLVINAEIFKILLEMGFLTIRESLSLWSVSFCGCCISGCTRMAVLNRSWNTIS